MKHSPPIAITMGDPAGIGIETVIKAWQQRVDSCLPPFYLIGDSNHLVKVSERAGLRLPYKEIKESAEANDLFSDFLPVIDCQLAASAFPGQPEPANGSATIQSIELAVEHVASGQARAIVTNPINKKVLHETGFDFPGHTEFLADLAVKLGASQTLPHPVMMLAIPDLRVVPLTIHTAIADVPNAITKDLLCKTARVLAKSLEIDFGFHHPRIAVAGLNPHAGESGSFGNEEVDTIAPAIEDLKAEDIDIAGPFPADTLFHAQARSEYDGVLCMYHDQALIPLKTIDFFKGVNITLGLPFVRTSPDHGTGYDIAGTFQAVPDSLIEAIRTADSIANMRERDR